MKYFLFTVFLIYNILIICGITLLISILFQAIFTPLESTTGFEKYFGPVVDLHIKEQCSPHQVWRNFRLFSYMSRSALWTAS